MRSPKARKGIQNGRHRIDGETVKEIRGLQGQLSQRELAKMFQISRTNIFLILHKKIWIGKQYEP